MFSGATLLFDVELMGINQAPPPQNVFKQIDIDSDNQLSKEEVNFFHLLCTDASAKKKLFLAILCCFFSTGFYFVHYFY